MASIGAADVLQGVSMNEILLWRLIDSLTLGVFHKRHQHFLGGGGSKIEEKIVVKTSDMGRKGAKSQKKLVTSFMDDSLYSPFWVQVQKDEVQQIIDV